MSLAFLILMSPTSASTEIPPGRPVTRKMWLALTPDERQRPVWGMSVTMNQMTTSQRTGMPWFHRRRCG